VPLPDISATLRSFQASFERGEIQLRPGQLDKEIFVFLDHPNGEARLTYVRLSQGLVVALVQFIRAEPVEGEACFAVAWAVPPGHRGQGLAGKTFLAALAELRHGLAAHGALSFWVEGVVGAENLASQRVAERVISAPASKGVDRDARVPVVQYLRKIDAQSVLSEVGRG